MNPLISIIIPVYNRQKELMLSLASIQKQTYRPLEVIIVDDGSTEEIRKLGNWEIKGIPLIIYKQENQGAPAARNKGFELSKGEYVIFWDADIIGDPYMIEKMYKALQEDTKSSFSYSNFYFGSHKMPGRVFDATALQQTNYITTTSLIRREDFPGFDTSLKRFQDWDLWLTFVDQNKTGVWVPEYLFTILPHEKGMSSWMPSFAYKAPFKYLPPFKKKVEAYNKAKEIVIEKHRL